MKISKIMAILLVLFVVISASGMAFAETSDAGSSDSGDGGGSSDSGDGGSSDSGDSGTAPILEVVLSQVPVLLVHLVPVLQDVLQAVQVTDTVAILNLHKHTVIPLQAMGSQLMA